MLCRVLMGFRCAGLFSPRWLACGWQGGLPSLRSTHTSTSVSGAVHGTDMTPLPARFAAACERIGLSNEAEVAVAVSGGADSMALALMTAAHFPRCHAIIVDHRLRAESTCEARMVSCWLTAREISNEIRSVEWKHGLPTQVQSSARSARYRALLHACADRNIDVLLTAHHYDDLLETFVMRLAQCSGVEGLAGIQTSTKIGPESIGEDAGVIASPLLQCLESLTLYRPLLGVRKVEFEMCRSNTVEYVNDPSNENLKYRRVAVRSGLDMLYKQGEGEEARNGDMCITPAILGSLVSGLQTARVRVEEQMKPIVCSSSPCVWMDKTYGVGFVSLSPFITTVDTHIQSRLMGSMIGCVCGNYKRPRQEQTTRAIRLLKTWQEGGHAPSVLALAGCLVVKNGNDTACVVKQPPRREHHAVVHPLPRGEPVWWDRRFVLTVKEAEGNDLGVRYLTKKDLPHWPKEKKRRKWERVKNKMGAGVDARQLSAPPHPAIHTLPVVVDLHSGVALCAPHLQRSVDGLEVDVGWKPVHKVFCA